MFERYTGVCRLIGLLRFSHGQELWTSLNMLYSEET